MSFSNSGSVDLEAVLNVRRRTLTSISETVLPRHRPRYTDTIYIKREDKGNSILSFDSKIVIFGELQLLCSIFERYTSHINVYDESSIESSSSSSPLTSTKPSFSTTIEEDEEDPPIVSTLRETTISSPDSQTQRKPLGFIGRSQTLGSSASEFSYQNLDGKRYGCIQLPNISIIEILEIFFRVGLELVNISSDYDKQNVLHQNIIFSKIR